MRGSPPPENLFHTALMLVPADVPPVKMWAIYDLIDAGRVAHGRYVGYIPRIDDETAEALLMRATKFAQGG